MSAAIAWESPCTSCSSSARTARRITERLPTVAVVSASPRGRAVPAPRSAWTRRSHPRASSAAQAYTVPSQRAVSRGSTQARAERAHNGEHQELRCEPRPGAGGARPVLQRRPGDRDEGPERDERAREQGRRRLDAREGTHAGRASSAVWRGVSSATNLQRMRVTIEYCVV